ncbi:MAG: hypothetical protein JKY37_17245 [Nannocystaceae bacterium]|nr:hypothetical protein [Nannocystaceae bacterium]
MPVGLWVQQLLLAASVGCGTESTLPAPPAVELTLGPTAGPLSSRFSLTAHGSGTKTIGAFDFESNVGTMEIDGVVRQAFVYERINWTEIGRTLFQGFAASNSELLVFWLFCNSETGVLTEVQFMTTINGTIVHDPASGMCVSEYTPTTSEVTVPALDLSIPRLVEGFTIDGLKLHLDTDGRGSAVVDEVELELYVFGLVDCRDCPGSPAWELHSLLYDREADRMCFTIFYLHLNPGRRGL